jgi:hypothetical protein
MKTLCVGLLLSVALCGCNAAKQAASTPAPTPTTPTPALTISLVGNWTGNIYGNNVDTPIPFSLDVVTSADGSIYFSVAGCDFGTNLTIVSGTNGQFTAGRTARYCLFV